MEIKMKNKAIITTIIKLDAIVAKTSVTLSIAFSLYNSIVVFV